MSATFDKRGFVRNAEREPDPPLPLRGRGSVVQPRTVAEQAADRLQEVVRAQGRLGQEHLGQQWLPVLVYDGSCGFCTACVDWLDRRLLRPVFAVPYQWADLDALGLEREAAARAVWWIDGTRHSAHAAVAKALSACVDPWGRVGALLQRSSLSAPCRLGYALVSRMRGWLPAAAAECERNAGSPSGRVLGAR